MSLRAILPGLGMILAASAAQAQSVVNSTSFQPGTPAQPGTTTINGNYTQTSTGTLQIRFNGAGQANDQLFVTGTANLNGTLQVIAPTNIAGNQSIAIVEANGGLLGKFATLSGTNLGLFKTLSLSYDPNNAYLTVTQLSFSSVAKTPNQAEAGFGLDQTLTSTNTAFSAARDKIGFQSAAAAAAELGRIGGEGYASATMGGFMASRAFSTLLLRAAEDDRGELKNKRRDGWSVWASGLDDTDKWSDSKNQVADVHASVNGGAVGFDYSYARFLRMGAAFGYLDGSTKPQTQATNIGTKAYEVGFFVILDGALPTSLVADFGHDNYTFARLTDSGAAANAKSNGTTFNMRADLSVPYRLAKGWLLAPFIEANYTSASHGSFQEATSDLFALAVNSKTSTSLEGDLGSKIGYTYDGDGWKFIPELRLAAAFETQKKPFSVGESFLNAPSATFTQFGPQAEQITGRAQLSLSIKFDNGISTFVDYSARIGSKDSSQVVVAGVKFAF